MMECQYCKTACRKAGKQANGRQKYHCKGCGKYQQSKYIYGACKAGTDERIVAHIKEGCGINNIVRLLSISKSTAIARIKRIAMAVEPSHAMAESGSYEVDELHTFIGRKAAECYVAYAICRQTRRVVDFVIGPRTKTNLGRLTGRLMESMPRRINTDGLNVYPSLIPKTVHSPTKRGTLRIERKSLTLRINLKRLARRTICFSRSAVMLDACLRIWFWGSVK